MVIEKLHGLHSTGISMNDRFTVLASASPFERLPKPRKRNPAPAMLNQTLDIQNQFLIEQIAKRLGQQARRKSIRQRLGVSQGALRRFGSETSLPGLRRSNSFGNLSQGGGLKNRIGWGGSNNNLSRSASFSNLSEFRPRRGFRRRGGVRILRGRFRSVRGLRQGRITRATQKGNMARRGGFNNRGRARGRGRGNNYRGRGKPRGGVTRQQEKEVPTKEELDNQLDEYMSSTKSALDKELDEYMKSAMDLE